MSQRESHLSPQNQRPITASSATAYPSTDTAIAESEVAKLAFEKFGTRGCAHGFDKEGWEAASRELPAKASGPGHSASVTPFR